MITSVGPPTVFSLTKMLSMPRNPGSGGGGLECEKFVSTR